MKISLSKYTSLNINLRIFTFLLIIIQSCGIRFFDGQGTVLALVILTLSYNGFKYYTQKNVLITLGIFLLLFLIKILNPLSFDINKLIFQLILILEAYVFLLQYKNQYSWKILSDFYDALKIIFLHALLSYLLYLLLPFLYTETQQFGYPYRSFLNIFYVTNDDVPRNIGLLWEPGLLQLMLNLFLFIAIQKDKPIITLFIIVLVIFSTISTTGFLGLAINYLFYIVSNYKTKKQNVFILILLPILFSGSLYFIWDNIADKMGGENTSGLVRYRDFLIGMDLIREKPLFGHGLFESSYLLSKSSIGFIEANIFSNEYLDISGDMGGGYTNGLLAIFCWYGIPLGLLIFYGFYKNKIIYSTGFKRLCFSLILLFTFISEPITYTAFFFLFPFSCFILNSGRNDLNKPINE
ncbi:MAG: O-antigen ligase domain-containing protein [Pedobacter sp.]|nr:MAG: O-antigen ligase domain-containing protein [Pedobacter sp.]